MQRRAPDDRVIALAGNPNVGKSTLFNTLTGANQHTGNWPGKTVATAQGHCTHQKKGYVFVDLPGTYSLMPHSTEEEVARDFLLSGAADAVVVVCDATCLERNLNLALQTIELSEKVLVCVNLLDEAQRKGLGVNLPLLEQRLGVPVVGISAGRNVGIDAMMDRLALLIEEGSEASPAKVFYCAPLEEALSILEPEAEKRVPEYPSRWYSLRLLDDTLPPSATPPPGIAFALSAAQRQLAAADFTHDKLTDAIVSGLVRTAEDLSHGIVSSSRPDHDHLDRRLDRLFTSRRTGIPIMLLLLTLILWITITGANYPSALLSEFLFWVQEQFSGLLLFLSAPEWLRGLLADGAFRVLAWVISVMLPPMAIFFPLFTLLEDFGYLPRVAFNLDHAFQKAKTCGKQALTMCMGFGCNAVGVSGTRIIDSPRERIIAMVTNCFVPCNGRFPLLIAMITMFFAGSALGMGQVLGALLLTATLVLGILMTFLMSRLLSSTVLKGVPSSFTLELPPYRKPRVGQVLVRSVLDRTLFVLGRAVVVAIPAGIIIWVLANVTAGEMSLLSHCAAFLDPFAGLLGLDGVILLAFILGFPANEIVLPIIIMAYLSTGQLVELSSMDALRVLLVENGWTMQTAACTMLFSLMHWPCSTTCLTIYKESRSLRWTGLSILLPTAAGMAACFLLTTCINLFGLFFS